MPWVKEPPAEGEWVGEKFFGEWAVTSFRYPYVVTEITQINPDFAIEIYPSLVERVYSKPGFALDFNLFEPIVEVYTEEVSTFSPGFTLNFEQKEPIVIKNVLETGTIYPSMELTFNIDTVAVIIDESDSLIVNPGFSLTFVVGV